MEILILFGKQLYKGDRLDWVAESRCDLAIELLNKYPSTNLIISGGKTTDTSSEASVMQDYILENMDCGDRIVLEENGLSSIHQLFLLKTQYLIPNNHFNVGLITDEIHIARVELIASHLLGTDYKIETFGSEVKMAGYYRKAMEKFEKELFNLASDNPLLKHFPPGDHKSWQIYDEFYRNKKKERSSIKLDVNEEFLEYIKTLK